MLLMLPLGVMADEDVNLQRPYQLTEDSKSIMQYYDLKVFKSAEVGCEGLISIQRSAIASVSLKDLNIIPNKTPEYFIRREFLADAQPWVRWKSPQYFNFQKVQKLDLPTQQLCMQSQLTDRKLKRISALFVVGSAGLDRKLLQVVFPDSLFTGRADFTIVLTAKKTSDPQLFYLKEVYFTFDPFNPELAEGSVSYANVMQPEPAFNRTLFIAINIIVLLLMGLAVIVLGLAGVSVARRGYTFIGLCQDDAQIINGGTRVLIFAAAIELTFVILLYWFSVNFRGRLELYFGFRLIMFAGAILLVTFDDLINRRLGGPVETGWLTPKQIINTVMLKKFSAIGSILMLAITIQINKNLGYIFGYIALYCLVAMIFQVRGMESRDGRQ